MEHRDDIDRWLYENVGVLPGCCSAQEGLKYSVAREVAEKLWRSAPGVLDAVDLELAKWLNHSVAGMKQGNPAYFQGKVTLIHDLRGVIYDLRHEEGGGRNLEAEVAQDHAPTFARTKSDFGGQNRHEQ